MTTILIIGLGAMTLLCLALIFALNRTITIHDASIEGYREREAYINNEWLSAQRFNSGITRILNNYTGGISKRLSESREIATAIHQEAPDLFRKSEGLLYCLHANDQFLSQLYSVGAEGIDKDHRNRVLEQQEHDREAIFFKAYESAGLQPPANSTPR